MSALAPREPLFTPRFAMLWVYAFITFFSAFQLFPAMPLRILAQGLAWGGLSSTAAVALAPPIGLWIFHYGWTVLCLELAALSAAMTVWAIFLPARDAPRPGGRLAISDAWDWRVVKTTLSFTVM